MKNKSRILWIDISKAIAILLMIIGHVLPYGSEGRNLIFSFHMPLFFILTGYTISKVTDFKVLCVQIVKNFKKIYIPCIVTQLISIIISFMLNGGNFIESLKISVKKIFWASAVDVGEHLGLGALWFLVVLFWAKILFLLIDFIIPHKNKGIIYLFLALTGKFFSKNLWLPQSMDVVFVAVIFIYVGSLMREHRELLTKHQVLISTVCFALWMTCWEQGIYIEMGARYYPLFILCIIEAVCASFCIMSLAQVIEGCGMLSDGLAMLGQHTLFLLCVHHIEWNFSYFWTDKGTVTICMIRLIYAIGLLLCFLLFKKVKSRLLRA